MSDLQFTVLTLVTTYKAALEQTSSCKSYLTTAFTAVHDAGADQLLAINACVLQLLKYTDYRRRNFKHCYEPPIESAGEMH